MIKYTVKRKGHKVSSSFAKLKDAKAFAAVDLYCVDYHTGKIHPDVYIIKEIHEKVWAGSKEELKRELPEAWSAKGPA